jgi:hypothetical protein
MLNAVNVQFSVQRDEENAKDFWMRVTATPIDSESEYVERIRIVIYQCGGDEDPDALTPYEMENGKSYGWGMEYSDVFVILVSYRDKRYGDQIAAQGVWWSDGETLRSGKTIRGRSEIFA